MPRERLGKRSACPRQAPVAQGIEYWPPKPRVAGSIPAGRAIVLLVLSIACCRAWPRKPTWLHRPLIGAPVSTCFGRPIICASPSALFFLSVDLRKDGLREVQAGNASSGQVIGRPVPDIDRQACITRESRFIDPIRPAQHALRCHLTRARACLAAMKSREGVVSDSSSLNAARALSSTASAAGSPRC